MITVYDATCHFADIPDLEISGEYAAPDAPNGDSGEVLVQISHGKGIEQQSVSLVFSPEQLRTLVGEATLLVKALEDLEKAEKEPVAT